MLYNRGFSLDAARLDLIDAIYAATTDPSRWQDFNDRAAHWFGGGSTTFVIPKGDNLVDEFHCGTLDPVQMKLHDEYYNALSPWLLRVGHADPLDVLTEMVPEDELVRTEYYNDWLAPQDYHHLMSVRPILAQGDALGLGIGRAKSVGTFDAAERRVLIDIAPHLARSVDISRRLSLLGQQSRAASGLLDVLGAGLLLVGQNMQVVYANAVAEGLLATGDGLRAPSGRLACASWQEDAALREAVRTATSFVNGQRLEGTTLTVDRESGEMALSITVSPLDQRESEGFGTGPYACLIVSVPELDVGIEPERLRAAYDLTPAEARLVIALCSGRSLADYGEEAGISINTAKYHLKAVFDKTGETRQAELVRRMLSNPAIRAGDFA